MNDPAILDLTESSDVRATIAGLTLERESILLLLGSFDAALNPQVRSLCARAIAPAAYCAKALVVDDGGASGLTPLIGAAVQELEQAPTLLAILDTSSTASSSDAPASHAAVLRLSEPTPAGKLWFQLVAALADAPPQSAGNAEPAPSEANGKTSEASSELPVVVVLVGGGDAEKTMLLRCIRRRWPVVIFQGGGGLGDQILDILSKIKPGTSQQAAPGTTAAPPQVPAVAAEDAPPAWDPDLLEIAESDLVFRMQLYGTTDDIQRVLLELLHRPTETLADAWSRFDDYDRAAEEKQRTFRIIQVATLTLAVFATLLAIASSITQRIPGNSVLHGLQYATALHIVLHCLLILTPIVISVLVGINSRFREGNKWLILRSAAEAIKGEIYRYRAGAGIYSDESCVEDSAQSKLAAKIKELSSNVVRSEVNKSNLPERHVQVPGRLTFLNPQEYLVCRTEDQVSYFASKTQSIYRKLRRMQIWILFVGGLGTFLAAIGVDLWVALTTSIAGALTAKLEMDQYEALLVQYNIALTGLKNVASWWKALTPWERKRRKNIDLLVDQTEIALSGESAGWMKQMQTALDKLTEKESALTGRPAAAQQKS
jgi:hypothetical protein